jgi:hypothetical protein
MEIWRGMWDLNPRGLSTTDLAGLPPTRLGQSRTGNNYNFGTCQSLGYSVECGARIFLLSVC